MDCVTERIAVGGTLAALAGTGVILVVGAPTVVVSALGAATVVGAILSAIAAMIALKECYRRRGMVAEAEKVARTIERLEAQVKDLQKRFGLG